MIDIIFETSDSIKKHRSLNDVFTYAVSELGELAEEINIVTGYSSKQAGKDGIVGEAVDCILCLMDLIRQYEPNITEDQLMIVVDRKLKKWKDKT